MRFMMFVRGNEQTESGVLPEKQLFADMEAFNAKLKAAGALIALDGLHPSSKGARVSFADGQTTVVDGPFPPNELVAGFWIINVKSKDEAVGWAKQVPFKTGAVEIRQIQEMSDFPPEIKQVIESGVPLH